MEINVSPCGLFFPVCLNDAAAGSESDTSQIPPPAVYSSNKADSEGEGGSFSSMLRDNGTTDMCTVNCTYNSVNKEHLKGQSNETKHYIEHER